MSGCGEDIALRNDEFSQTGSPRPGQAQAKPDGRAHSLCERGMDHRL